ncbi:MAG: hypothetical protein KA175_01285 [Flavobacteriales bacterium]|nr:hypothetical protein [Flavobacteriales bacterium]MBP6696218.1 hypothetical protein [Flavobacteriales bacterium]
MTSIKIGLDGLTALDKVAKAVFIGGKMTGNATFPTPVPTLAALDTARENLELAIAAALDGGKSVTFAKNEAEADLDEVITQLAGYVVSIAGADEVKIRSAGFDVRRRGSPIGELLAPGNLRADLTEFQGQIATDWDPVYGARLYEVYRNDSDPAVEAEWKLVAMTTKSKHLEQGLASGSTHWFRIKALGTAGESPLSDPAQAMAR